MRTFAKVGLAAVVVALVTTLPLVWAGGEKISGEVKVDGSSTVYLISEAMAKEFKRIYPGVNITIGISGTGGGFKKFYNGETDISNASRAIKSTEAEKCKENGIDYVELKVGIDGLAVIVNQYNDWARNLTVEQLKKIWHPNTDNFKNVSRWSDLDPSWPNEKIDLYGAGHNSGTFDYFTEAINGKEKIIRPDYTPSEDDNVTLKGVIGNKYAIGFLGYAYYEANKESLNVVSITPKEGGAPVAPTPETILSGKYKPLSRPLFIYVKKASLQEPQVREFVQFHLRRTDLIRRAGYVPLRAIDQLKERSKLSKVLEEIGK